MYRNARVAWCVAQQLPPGMKVPQRLLQGGPQPVAELVDRRLDGEGCGPATWRAAFYRQDLYMTLYKWYRFVTVADGLPD
jgi:hypothetical protein